MTPATAGCGSTHKDRAPPGATRFLLGEWLVDVPARRLQLGELVVTLEPRPMAVLVELCQRPRELLNAETLLSACWPGEPMGDHLVHKVVAGLRRALRDSATEPQYIETIRKQGYRLVAPIRVLSDEGSARSHTGGWRGQSPFRGLEPFGAGHASVFFGRDDAVALLHARLGEQVARGHPLVVLLGPSGSGKTSLVQAGLLPALLTPLNSPHTGSPDQPLRACAAATVDLAALSNLDAWHALAGALLDWECGDALLLSGHSIDTLALALRERCDEVLRLLRIGLSASGFMPGDAPPPAPPVLVLDRLEALFQPATACDVQAFVDCIDRLVRSRLMLVLAVCRNDFYPELANYPSLMRDKQHGAHVDLAPPDAEAIAQIIRLPARAAGLAYGTDASGMNRLEDRLCADCMHAPDALPLLQYTLQELYLSRGPGNELTWDAYLALGRLEGAIGRRAEAVLDGLPPAQQEALAGLLPRVMSIAVEDATPTGRWVTEAELTNVDERALVQAFVNARLLVSDRVGGATGFRVAHEALLRRWPRVTNWVLQHRAGLAAREELAPWVRRWVDDGRRNALLLPEGAALWQADRALAEAPRLFGDDERSYLARSHARIKQHARLRVGAAVGVLALTAMAALAAAGYAHQARVASDRERQSQRLTTFMLGDLADQLRPVGKIELLAGIGEQGLAVLGSADPRGELPADALQRAKALVVIGEVNSSRGKNNSEIAVPALLGAQELLARLEPARGVRPADYYRTLGTSSFWLGQIAFDAGHFDDAQQWMESYRLASSRWKQVAPDDTEAAAEMSYSLGSLGAIRLRRADWSDAERVFREALGLQSLLAAKRPNDVALRRSVADTTTWLGQLAYLRGAPGEALALYARAQALRASEGGSPVDAEALHDMGILQQRRSEALGGLGRITQSLQALESAVATLADASNRDVQNAWWAAEQLQAELGLAVIRARDGQDVTVHLRDLGARLEAQSARGSNLGTLLDVARLRWLVASALFSMRSAGNSQASMALSRTALEHGRDLLRRRPDAWQAAEEVARLLLAHVSPPSRAGAVSASLATSGPAFCADARDVLGPAASKGQAGLALEGWLVARHCAGDTSDLMPEFRRLQAGGYLPMSASQTLFNRP